jgi:hypothetical protein
MDDYDPGKPQPGSMQRLGAEIKGFFTSESATMNLRLRPRPLCAEVNCVAEKAAELLVTQKLLDQILKTPGNLIALETTHVNDALVQFRTLAMRTGTSMYLWEPDGGISSLRESGLRVPGSKRITDALRYVLQSMHFGVYIFTSFEDHLKPPDTVLLRRISRIHTGNERKILFLGANLSVPEEIEGALQRLNPDSEVRTPPRLRDGRWVS